MKGVKDFFKGWELADVYRTITAIAIIYLSVQYSLTWSFTRNQVYPNCVAVCKGMGNFDLDIIEFSADRGIILCTCSNIDIPIYFNNYSYVREPNITDILFGGFE